ncbi:hypothetical protein CC85DRAFT_314231 [Cutaneotrichosporon oleaginosum]|uniref:TNFR-Cys domain-containing protein n=1 Tax=Cutaneotrichosporon oleaginosum TaxID=879819 RepID=A0A0J0XCJ8_9TREE|nr:uncharacterized protein CC85DRAFT_314231 [Cutaneotrichosporon oleaginosum]KLT38786.1 hypothetical protein CC85DRAFT_314231 [Cutaneotrichosporon oleaginosum]TXT09945.1 hypothetical protein COLE_03879 [Cutaneotrichosporon oleaginosum]
MLPLKLQLVALTVLGLAHALVPRQAETCSPGLFSCDGKCRDLQTDAQNCGACGWPCAHSLYPGGTCENGKCVCPDGGPGCAYDFGNYCPDFFSDIINCGGCNRACSSDQPTCVNGTCAPCPEDTFACFPDLGVKCANLSSDDEHCGQCFAACDTAAGGKCVGGECVCPANLSVCPGLSYLCIDTQSDRAHCGRCFQSCPYKCEGGKCIDCPHGLTGCDGECTNLANDNGNCGKCRNLCSTGQNCVDGTCVGGPSGCPRDQEVCSDECINVQNDNRHCGACEKQCAAGKNCVNGKCV